MTTNSTNEELRKLFQSPFCLNAWMDILQNIFKASQLRKNPQQFSTSEIASCGYYLGCIDTSDGYHIGLFHYEIQRGSVLKKRVGLRNLVRSFINNKWGTYDAALVTYNSGDSWRFSFISDIKGTATHPKRYTYVFGNHQLRYKTPVERFTLLTREGISYASLLKAFSVEALSDEFFNRYREFYADFVQYISGTRYEKEGSKWVEKKKGDPHEMFSRAFKNDAKKVRDYIKKMMGRITFLHFLQRKGWLTGDLNYMQNLFLRSERKDDYLDSVLEPLFFGVLNTKEENREQIFSKKKWDMHLLEEWKSLPYLNGGLFEEDMEDTADCCFPQEYFARLFEFFSEYNFTIDENSPNDAEVGVDPEMLGKIFENLLEDNKDKGAFYTPKEIVQFMCRESLLAYLNRVCKDISSEKDLRAFITDPDEVIACFTQRQKKKLQQALSTVKICDPAIGSGAFPMGLLNELIICREALEKGGKDRATLKKDIICNNIYGVDIEKGAVDIARLRFWLSIVVDEDAPSPLPNLDYKIMQGDSLRESYMGCNLSSLGSNFESHKYQKNFNYASDAIQLELIFGEADARKEMQKLIQKYYGISSHAEKEKLRASISSTIQKFILSSGASREVMDALSTLEIPNNQFFLWHTFFGDVLQGYDNPGFDIIIGNPPYIQLQDKKMSLGDIYEPLGFETFSRKGDIYCLFYEKSLHLLKQGGHLCFITSNKWMRSDYGKDLRSFFATKTNPKLLIDCGGYQVFKNATVDTNILLFAKETNQKETLSITLPKSGVDNLSDFVQHHSSKCSFTSSNSWVILSPIEQSIKNKIEAIGKPLKEWDVNIYRGILTGCNEAFIISTEKRDEILNNCADIEERTRTEALIRPILRGRDIKRYGYEWANLWLIATFPSRKYDIDEYPAVKKYLLTFAAPMLQANNFGWVAENHLKEYCYKRLEQTGKKIIISEKQISFHKNEGARKKTNNKWFETQDNISYWDDFSKPKIVWAETMRRHKGKTNRFPRFSHDELGYLTDKTCFMGVGADALYIAIFLNSYMGEYLCDKYVSILDNGGYLMQKVYLNEIPIADATRKEQTNLIALWQQNCNNDKIDQLIFNIFNLDVEEKKYIYNQLGKFASIR